MNEVEKKNRTAFVIKKERKMNAAAEKRVKDEHFMQLMQ